MGAAQSIVADKDYDNQAIRDQIEQQGAKTVIPEKWNSKTGNADPARGLYRYRHLVENIFCTIESVLGGGLALW
ncbi:hypothetical protein C8R14_11123 [Nitrosomonas eutropha]|uniref:Transposase DDE domain-containing protein n=1 Tax=Nitrosomonas eutropha TaxID=916 RepID=A0ABX5M780_9PROT|nr:hypothetical protein C8R14_11123 [Nitrosomonas eutropha]SEJ30760.1 hypothetical protein SAMN05216318_1454 [Nitrosomonas eutropha]